MFTPEYRFLETMQVLQKTQVIIRYQDQASKIHYGFAEDDEIQQLSSNFNEIVCNQQNMMA
jgi:hypothetical protein